MDSIIVDISVQGTRAYVLLMDGNWTESTRLVIGNLVEKWFGGEQTVRRLGRGGGMPRVESGGEKTRDARDKAGKKDSVWVIQATVAPRSATDRPGHSWFLANESVAAGPTIPILFYLPINLGEKV